MIVQYLFFEMESLSFIGHIPVCRMYTIIVQSGSETKVSNTNFKITGLMLMMSKQLVISGHYSIIDEKHLSITNYLFLLNFITEKKSVFDSIFSVSKPTSPKIYIGKLESLLFYNRHGYFCLLKRRN